jgi:hypothetical protein
MYSVSRTPGWTSSQLKVEIVVANGHIFHPKPCVDGIDEVVTQCIMHASNHGYIDGKDYKKVHTFSFVLFSL